jgi:serine/threonine-protein kinase
VPSTGDVIADRYRLEEKLGTGAMGSVWRASHISLESTVAIKIIRESAARNPRSLARFEREAVLAARIDSAHVVRVIDHGHHDGLPFIVMDHLQGEDLRARLERLGVLDVASTADIVRDACRALTAAHAVGLVHRDIKPENIFLTRGAYQDEERAVVLDFGVAKATDTLAEVGPTQTGALIGTPYYLSPEQAQGLKTVGPAADQWALAVVAFECLTGQRPFSAPSMATLIASITEGHIPVPSQLSSGLPPSLDAWFVRAFCRDPAGRFSGPEELGRTFEAAVRGTSPEAAPPAALPREAAAHTLVLTDSAETLALDDAAKTMVLPEEMTLPSPLAPTVPQPPALPEQPDREPPRRVATRPGAGRRRWIGIAVAAIVAAGMGASVAAVLLLEEEPSERVPGPAPNPKPSPALPGPSATPPRPEPPPPDAGASASTSPAPTPRPRRKRGSHRRRL